VGGMPAVCATHSARRNWHSWRRASTRCPIVSRAVRIGRRQLAPSISGLTAPEHRAFCTPAMATCNPERNSDAAPRHNWLAPHPLHNLLSPAWRLPESTRAGRGPTGSLHAGVAPQRGDNCMRASDLIFVIPTYRLRDVGQTVEHYDEHFWRNGHAVR